MRAYTQMTLSVKRLSKAMGITVQQFIALCLGRPEFMIEQLGWRNTDDMSTGLGSMVLEYNVHLGKAVHIFMPDRAFCDWLVNCAQERIDHRHVETLWYGIGKKEVVVLHFPTESGLTSVACASTSWIPNMAVNMTDMPPHMVMTASTSPGPAWAEIVPVGIDFEKIGTSEALEPVLEAMGDIVKQRYYHRLVSGLGQYLDCFPETMIDGLPGDLKHPAHHQNPCNKTLGITPKVVVGQLRDGVTPHFREGHFRTLKSEKFVHKRWQTVWVRACMVKGEAKTELTPDEADEKAATGTEG